MVVLILLLLLALPAGAGRIHVQSATGIDGNWLEYGCATRPVVKNRAGFVYWTQKRFHETLTQSHSIDLGINSLAAPGSDFVTEESSVVDPLRYWVYYHKHETQKPRLMWHPRADLTLRTGNPTTTLDPRFNDSAKACRVGTHANKDGSNHCTFGAAPMCSGGTRDTMFCPDGDDSFCPGGTCEEVQFNPLWVLTIPAEEHDEVMARFAAVTTAYTSGGAVSWDPTFLCDGTDFADGGDSGCGTGYPDFADLADALANLPEDSIGFALATEQQAWPLLYKPVYYGAAGGIQEDTPSPGEWTLGGINTVGVDMRIEAWQDYYVAYALDHIYHSFMAAGATDAEAQSWPITVNSWLDKPGWWSYYDVASKTSAPKCADETCAAVAFTSDTPPCAAAPSTKRWGGPANPIPGLSDAQIHACADAGGPIQVSPYGPGEWENAAAAIGAKLLAQTTSDLAGGYFTDVDLTADDAPALRNIKNEGAAPSIQHDPRWIGARTRVQSYDDPPWSAGEKACRVTPIVNAGGPYVVASGGTVRLHGYCVAPSTVDAAWSVASGGTNCAFENPFDDSADTADPLGNLAGCTADGTITLTCGTATSTATVDVQ